MNTDITLSVLSLNVGGGGGGCGGGRVCGYCSRICKLEIAYFALSILFLKLKRFFNIKIIFVVDHGC